MTDNEKKGLETPERAINALINLLDDILEDLTIVHLYAHQGKVDQRLLAQEASKVVCVNEDSPDDKIEEEGMIWLNMDPTDFFDRERVPDVGMVFVSPPAKSDLNRDILNQLPNARNLEQNCLVLIQEPSWNKTLMDNFSEYELIEDMEYDGQRIAVTQMISEF